MNIFVLHHDPEKCAEYHNDTHINKMLIEAVQILSTANYINGSDQTPYKPTHFNHPCVKWAAESDVNFNWLYSLAINLAKQYVARKGKYHATINKLTEIKPKKCGYGIPDKFVIGFNTEKYADCIIESDVIESYRNYYRIYKQGFYRKETFVKYQWTKTDKPYFMYV